MWDTSHQEDYLAYSKKVNVDGKNHTVVYKVFKPGDDYLKITRTETTEQNITANLVYVSMRGWLKPWTQQTIEKPNQRGASFIPQQTDMQTTVIRCQDLFHVYHGKTWDDFHLIEAELFIPNDLMQQMLPDIQQRYGLVFGMDFLNSNNQSRPLQETLLGARS